MSDIPVATAVAVAQPPVVPIAPVVAYASAQPAVYPQGSGDVFQGNYSAFVGRWEVEILEGSLGPISNFNGGFTITLSNGNFLAGSSTYSFTICCCCPMSVSEQITFDAATSTFTWTGQGGQTYQKFTSPTTGTSWSINPRGLQDGKITLDPAAGVMTIEGMVSGKRFVTRSTRVST